MSIVSRPGTLGLFAVLAIGVSAPALADTDFVVTHQPEAGTVTRSQRVDISDLRLATPEGRARLDRRITLAAKKVCDYNGGYGLNQPKDYVRCFDKARTDALGDARLVQTASR